MIHHDPPAVLEFAEDKREFAVRILILILERKLAVDYFVKTLNDKIEIAQ